MRKRSAVCLKRKCFGAHYALMLHLFCDMLSLMTKRRYITISILEREKRLCVQQQPIGRRIFILEEHWIMNFPTVRRSSSHRGIMNLTSGIWDRQRSIMRSSAWRMWQGIIRCITMPSTKGIGMAGLNFVGNAVYAEVTEGKENVASFEFIPWVLRQCATMDEVRALLAKMNLVGTPFAEQFPASQTALDHRRRKRGDYGGIGGGWSAIYMRIRWAFSRTIRRLHSRCFS